VFHNCIGKQSHFFTILAANKKRNEQRKTGGGPPPAAFTPAEELALSKNVGRPLMAGVEGGVSTDPGGSSSHHLFIQGKSQGALNSWDAIQHNYISIFVGVSDM